MCCTQPAETSLLQPQHLLEERDTGKELLEDPHYGPMLLRRVIPGTQTGPVNPQGFSPTHPTMMLTLSVLRFQLSAEVGTIIPVHAWKRDLTAVGQVSPGTKAADLGKTAPFLLPVEHTTSFRPAKLSRGKKYNMTNII